MIHQLPAEPLNVQAKKLHTIQAHPATWPAETPTVNKCDSNPGSLFRSY